MRNAIVVVTMLAVAQLAWGDGPQDNIVEKVRPVPPPGVKCKSITTRFTTRSSTTSSTT
jgi:hypothetical protein